MKKVAVIMGSDSDWPVVKAAVEQLKDLSLIHIYFFISRRSGSFFLFLKVL